MHDRLRYDREWEPGKAVSDVLLNLKGVHSSSTATRPRFISIYMQLSRAERWEELYLFRKPVRADFIEPKLDKNMRAAVLRLERLGDVAREGFKRCYKDERWFQDWDAMPECASTTDAADEDDTSLWSVFHSTSDTLEHMTYRVRCIYNKK